MRQAGVVAAAGLYALRNNVERLREDHDKAARVAAALAGLPKFKLDHEPQTNMLFLHPDMQLDALIPHLADAGVKVNGHRWVFHLDVSDQDVEQLIDACRRWA